MSCLEVHDACYSFFSHSINIHTPACELLLIIQNNLLETPETLAAKGHTEPQALTPGMFGYSLLRPALNQEYFYDIFDQCKEFGVNIESFHTETGNGPTEKLLVLSMCSVAA